MSEIFECMATNPYGKGTRNIVVNVPDWLYCAILELATQNQKRLGAYVREVLKEAHERKVQFKTVATTKAEVKVMQGATPGEPFRLNEKPVRSSVGDRGAIEPGITGGLPIFKSKVAKIKPAS